MLPLVKNNRSILLIYNYSGGPTEIGPIDSETRDQATGLKEASFYKRSAGNSNTVV